MTEKPPVPPPPARRVARTAWRDGKWQDGERVLPEETPVAFTYGGATHAVMMATPSDLDDFAIGFSMTEGIITSRDDVEDIEVVPLEAGIDIRIWLHEVRADAMAERRRHMAGPVGCGMCGLESLSQAVRDVPRVEGGLVVTPDMISAAVASLSPMQLLNIETRAVHAAGFWQPDAGLVAIREDVGRHNAMDKLAGALAQARIAPSSGVLLLTSRMSVELVQKAAMIGAPLLVGVSAPTLLALNVAEKCGITLAAIARSDGFEVFTHPARIKGEAVNDVA